MVGSSAIIMGGGPPKAAAGVGQKQGESLLPFGVAAPGTHAPGTDRASQAAVAAWERAHGIGAAAAWPRTSAGSPPGSDLGGMAVVRYPVPVDGAPNVTAPVPPSSTGGHGASPTVIALAASALGLALVAALVAAGVAARTLARRRHELEAEGGRAVVVGAATAPSASASVSAAEPSGPSWWRWPAGVAGVRLPVVPFSGNDSALASPAAADLSLPPNSANISPGIAHRLMSVSVDDSAFGDCGGGPPESGSPGGGPPGSGSPGAGRSAVPPGPSRFASFLDRAPRRVEDSADPEA